MNYAHICHIDELIELAAIETGWILHQVHPNSNIEKELGKLPYEMMKRKVRGAIIVNNDTNNKKIRTIKPTHDNKIAYYVEG